MSEKLLFPLAQNLNISPKRPFSLSRKVADKFLESNKNEIGKFEIETARIWKETIYKMRRHEMNL